MKNPTLDIVLVDFNAGAMIRECLKSIEKNKQFQIIVNRIVIVDNGSSPGSREFVMDLNLPLHLIINNMNRGFATACNQGAVGSKSDYLLFLNPDTVLRADSLSLPLHFMERAENDKVGICGIQLIDDEGRVSRSCARFPTPINILSKILGLSRMWPRRFPPWFMEEWDHGNTRYVDQVMGAFFLTRKSLFDLLGGFDERFFLYFEEVDYSYRARKLGWATCYVADVQAFHKGGGTSNKVLPQRLYYSLRSRILYAKKHFTRMEAKVVLAETLLLESAARLILSMTYRSPYSLRTVFRVFGKLWLEFFLQQKHLDSGVQIIR
jgi:hypothetical protein